MEKDNNRYRFEEEMDNDINEPDVESDADDVENQKTESKQKSKTKNDKDECKEKKHKKTYQEYEAEIVDLKNQILLVKADGLNFKKRIEGDSNQSIKYANQRLMEKFVKELDLFDKVVSSETDNPALKNYLIGFQMINQNFKNVLSEEGIVKIDAKVGENFDSKYHHVLQTEWNEKYKENVILQVMQSGYMYKDRVLRPVLVKVNKKEGK